MSDDHEPRPKFDIAKITYKTYCLAQADYWIKYTGLPSYSFLYEAYTDVMVRKVEVMLKDQRIKELEARLTEAKVNSGRYLYLRDVLSRKEFRVTNTMGKVGQPVHIFSALRSRQVLR